MEDVTYKIIKLRENINEVIGFKYFEDADDYFQECEEPVLLAVWSGVEDEYEIKSTRLGKTIKRL